jgi:hypothetical protein
VELGVEVVAADHVMERIVVIPERVAAHQIVEVPLIHVIRQLLSRVEGGPVVAP